MSLADVSSDPRWKKLEQLAITLGVKEGEPYPLPLYALAGFTTEEVCTFFSFDSNRRINPYEVS